MPFNYLRERIDYISIKASIDVKGESPSVLRHRVYTRMHIGSRQLAHTQLIVDIYSTLWRSPFSRCESFGSLAVSFFSLFFCSFFPLHFLPSFAARTGEGREGEWRDWRAARTRICAYISTHRHAGGKRVRASRDANYLFYVPTGTP